MEGQIVSLDRSRRAYLAQVRLLIERQLSEITAAEQAAPNNNGGRDGSETPAWLGSLVKE
jgi:hypothetical protein